MRMDLAMAEEQENRATATKIFVVEDDLFYNKVMSSTLAANNYEVRSFTSGKEYLQQIKVERPDLVIMDCQLGDSTGLELLTHTKKLHSETDVVLISAQQKEEDRESILKSGARAFLTKDKLLFNKIKILALKAGLDKEEREKEKVGFVFRSVVMSCLTVLFLLYLAVEFL